MFGLWKSRGINTMVVVPQGDDEVSWNQAAVQDGLYEIRTPAANPATDVGNRHLLAWALPDQPDDVTAQMPYQAIAQLSRTWKRTDPGMPVYINFNGQFDQHDVRTQDGGLSWYGLYAASADWLTADLYPVNAGRGADLSSIGQEVAELRKLGGTKPVFVFIESGAYDAGNPVITPGQFRGEIWQAIISGARGIFYFPVQVSPTFAYDVTPPAVAFVMRRQDRIITGLASVLQGPIDPAPLRGTAPGPLRVAWRSSAGQSYFFVLNASPQTLNNQRIRLRGIGSAKTATVYGENRIVRITHDTITDDFGPFTVHIYTMASSRSRRS